LQEVVAGGIDLKDVDTHKRVQNLWTELFFSLQTHLLNVVVLVLLGWTIWYCQVPALPTWVRYIISVISVAAGLGDFLIARYLIRGYMEVRETRRLFASVYSRRKPPENVPGPLTTGEVLPVWAGIGMYSVSVVAAGSLIYVVWV
jgi:hypothetical protein